MRPVYAHEPSGVESPQEFTERHRQQVATTTHHQHHVVIIGFQALDGIHCDGQHATTFAYVYMPQSRVTR